MNMSDTKTLRQKNRDKILAAFMEHELCTKNQLALATGLSLATVSSILNELLKSSEVLFEDMENPVSKRNHAILLFK